MDNWKPIDRVRECGDKTDFVETSEFPIYRELEQTVFKLCCYYNAKTELYDRTLTDKRSLHDHTEAYLDNSLTRSLSNKYAFDLRERIIEFAEKRLNIRRDVFRKMFQEQNNCNHYSAQGWIDLYNCLRENGEMEFLITNCNLASCRYNKNGKCTNEEKRKECVDVSRLVLCLEEKENERERNKIENH